jgi:hypothetical protein
MEEEHRAHIPPGTSMFSYPEILQTLVVLGFKLKALHWLAR